MDVSIIIPVYNVENYIAQCLDSAINQSFPKDKYEIIIINDGSTDKSMEIVSLYKSKFSNIKIINQQNKGLSEARNVGMENAVGEYLYFLDSDDYINENTLSVCYDESKNNNLDLLTFDALSFYDGINEEDYKLEVYDRKKLIDESQVISGRKFFIDYYTFGGYLCSTCIFFFKKEFLRKNNLFFTKGILHEDEEFIFKAIMLVKRFKYNSHKLFNRRIRKNSIMTTKISERNIDSMLYIVNSNITFIKENGITNDLILSKYVKKYILNLYMSILKRTQFINRAKRKIYYKNVIENFINNYILLVQSSLTYQDNKYILDIYKIAKERNVEIEISSNILVKYEDKIKSYKRLSTDIFIDYLNEQILCYKIELLKRCDFHQPNKKVAIYGLGGHTINMLEFYNKYVGNIECKLFFIDSNVLSNSMAFLGKEVVNIKDINSVSVDKIVLSSLSYEKKFIDNIKQYAHSEIDIISFYNKEIELLF